MNINLLCFLAFVKTITTGIAFSCIFIACIHIYFYHYMYLLQQFFPSVHLISCSSGIILGYWLADYAYGLWFSILADKQLLVCSGLNMNAELMLFGIIEWKRQRGYSTKVINTKFP